MVHSTDHVVTTDTVQDEYSPSGDSTPEDKTAVTEYEHAAKEAGQEEEGAGQQALETTTWESFGGRCALIRVVQLLTTNKPTSALVGGVRINKNSY